MDRKTIGVIFGGKSGEHEVSRVSATYVLNAIDREEYQVKTIGITRQGEWLLYEGPQERIADGSWEEKARQDLAEDPDRFGFAVLGSGGRSLKDMIDFALPILHGPNGEDGTVQGVLELINIPYGGSGVAGCAVTMDKIIAKEVFANAGIPQTPYVPLTVKEIESGEAEAAVGRALRYPVFVKPANMGSSVGITKVSKPEELGAALRLAAKYDERIVVEQGVNCRELETAVMGNYDLFSGSVGEIVPAAEFYDYDAKYNNAASKVIIPAPIPEEQAEAIRDYARRAYRAAGCCGFSRVDFLLDKDSGEIYINEINAIPGFTSISMFPMLCMDAGLTYRQIISEIIRLGYERYNLKNNR